MIDLTGILHLGIFNTYGAITQAPTNKILT